MPADLFFADPRIGTADVDSWRAVRAIPAEGEPQKDSNLWAIVAGDYADEGEPDIYIEVRAGEYPERIAKFIVQAVQSEWKRVQSEPTVS